MLESALFTDYYELTMAQGYWKRGMNEPSVFDMFFRRQPFNGGFSVFAGLEPLLNSIASFRFSPEDLEWLSTLKSFDPAFIDYLEDFRFTGDVWAMDEGTIAFPNEPLLRVHANVIEAAIIEGLILNRVNFQSLIATKAARIWLASSKGSVMEFGLRRAQGHDGAMSASRAAFIGGASGTSNALAGRLYGIPALGTMAHSWVMSFKDEDEAFDAYAEMYPDRSVFLIDTYNTRESGIQAAIRAGEETRGKGEVLRGQARLGRHPVPFRERFAKPSTGRDSRTRQSPSRTNLPRKSSSRSCSTRPRSTPGGSAPTWSRAAPRLPSRGFTSSPPVPTERAA
jgi:nicotinate phosphoribosyltransferase